MKTNIATAAFAVISTNALNVSSQQSDSPGGWEYYDPDLPCPQSQYPNWFNYQYNQALCTCTLNWVNPNNPPCPNPQGLDPNMASPPTQVLHPFYNLVGHDGEICMDWADY